MPFFINPFVKHDAEYFDDVYVPLESARRHPSAMASHNERLSVGLETLNDESVKGPAQSSSDFSIYTLADLRAEIDLGK